MGLRINLSYLYGLYISTSRRNENLLFTSKVSKLGVSGTLNVHTHQLQLVVHVFVSELCIVCLVLVHQLILAFD